VNDTLPISLDNFVKDGVTLYDWLGTFWARIYEDAEFAGLLQQGEGLLAAQLYLTYVESLNLQDRYSTPVLHRARWFPIVIRKSQAGEGDATRLKIDMDPAPVIGPQIGETFVQGSVLTIGGTANLTAGISYPLPVDISDIVTSITDSIVNPKVILIRGVDYAVDHDTVLFLRNKDPFANTNFPRRIITDANGVMDEEIVIWACNMLIDADYIYNYIGYVLGIRSVSTEFYKRFLNGLWDLYNQGTPLSWLKSAIGAMLGEPTVIHPSEVIQTILVNANNQQIITSREVYTVPLNALLEDNVVVGNTLDQWQFLTKTIRLYTHIDPMKLTGATGRGTQFKTDVPVMFFDRSMLRARVLYGVAADWEVTDIVKEGVDSRGNARLRFRLWGTATDVNAFWSDFWAWLEAHTMTSEQCFTDYLYPVHPTSEGSVYGRVAPLEFLFRYFLKYNTFVIVVDKSKLAILGEGADQVAYLNLLQQVIPAHTRMIVEERYEPPAEDYDLNSMGSSVSSFLSTIKTETATYGGPSTAQLTYIDKRPTIRLIPTCG